MPSLWNLLSTPHLHEDHGGGCSLPKAEVDPNNPIPGRHTNHSRVQGTPSRELGNSAQPVTVPRLDHKLGEVQPKPQHGEGVFRHNTRLRGPMLLPPRGKGAENSAHGRILYAETVMHNPGGYVPPRKSNIMHPGGSMGTGTYQTPASSSPRSMGRQAGFVRKQNTDQELGKGILTLVDVPKKSKKRSPLDIAPGSTDHDRCKLLGVGGARRRPAPTGPMATADEASILKLQGATSNLEGPAAPGGDGKKPTYTSTVGQHHGSGPHPTPGGHEVTSSAKYRAKDISLGGGPHHLTVSGTLKGISESKSRLPQPGALRPRGMVLIPGGIPDSDGQMGSPATRPIRVKTKRQGDELLLPQTGRPTDSGGRPEPGLGRRTGVRISPDPTNPKGTTALQVTTVHPDPCGSLLAKKELVQPPERLEHPGASYPSGSRESPNAGTPELPRRKQTSSNSLVTEESILRGRGFSSKVVRTLMASRKETTNRIYQRIWRRFTSWRQERGSSGSSADVPLILDFLQDGLDMGLAPSTLRVQTAALSALFDTKLSGDRWINRFLAAADRLRPRSTNICPDWNLNLVLRAMTGDPFEPMEGLSLKMLTVKTIFLVAISSARRVSELQALSIRHPLLKITDTKLVFKTDPTFLPKVVSPFHRAHDIIIPSFYNHPKDESERTLSCLDVRRAVLTYIEATGPWRQDDNLFVQYSGPNKGKKAAKSSIARWIRLAISESYRALGKEAPSALKAHSTRAVATSWAEHGSASVEQICKAAVWKKPHTFVKHYRVKVQLDEDMSFGRKVLSAAIPP
ncbi:uncharacterized protein [Eleutherodactylus coqui]|uniref:uncharacterized protein n=1 Tax=Eleutherodactylus coqui TaxID=57060 RepID=UPI003462A973